MTKKKVRQVTENKENRKLIVNMFILKRKQQNRLRRRTEYSLGIDCMADSSDSPCW